MSIAKRSTTTVSSPKKRSGHTAPKAPEIALDQTGRLRVAHLLALLAISHTQLYRGMKPAPGKVATRYPKPDGHDGKFPWWRTSTIKAFLDA